MDRAGEESLEVLFTLLVERGVLSVDRGEVSVVAVEGRGGDVSGGGLPSFESLFIKLETEDCREPLKNIKIREGELFMYLMRNRLRRKKK